MNRKPLRLHISKSPAAGVLRLADDSWRLEIPIHTRRGYHLAQLDDYTGLRRGDFLWRPPLTLSLQARVSAQDLPGTWGFGFWNDPFSFLLGYEGRVTRFPTLPDAVWFFYASPHNYLSFRNDLPASGFTPATFSSLKVPTILLALASPALGLTFIPWTAQLIRRILRRVIQQDAALLNLNVTEWHQYQLHWEPGQVGFSLDGNDVWHTSVVPLSPLSLVIWIDNQYAALPPAGGLKYGTLPNPEPTWMEIRGINVLSDT